MKRLQRDAILVCLIDGLKQCHSWCGETHIQKSTYFLQELLGVPLEFSFILYKHGPYSFDLANELTSMRADDILKLCPQEPPYGPRILPGEASELLRRSFPKTIGRYRGEVEFLAREIGPKGVADLERLGTALYVTLDPETPKDEETRAAVIHELKPHIALDDAVRAVREVDRILRGARDVRSGNR